MLVLVKYRVNIVFAEYKPIDLFGITEPFSLRVLPTLFFLSAIIYPWLNLGLPSHCPKVVWCQWEEIEPFSATLAQDGLAEYDQPGKNPLKYSAVAGNWTRATGSTDRELAHWAIMTALHLPHTYYQQVSELC